MAEETFSQIGRIEAVRQLFEGTGYSPDGHCTLRVAKDTGSVINSTVMMTEGIDFDLTYFPLKHLGYKSVIEASDTSLSSKLQEKYMQHWRSHGHWP